MYVEFSHVGDDGAFVGFAPVAQSLDIGGNNGVAVRCGVGGHVEASTHLGATANDGAPAGELAAVAVEGHSIPVGYSKGLKVSFKRRSFFRGFESLHPLPLLKSRFSAVN